MLARAITAVDHLSPNLEFVVLQTGAKVSQPDHCSYQSSRVLIILATDLWLLSKRGSLLPDALERESATFEAAVL